MLDVWSFRCQQHCRDTWHCVNKLSLIPVRVLLVVSSNQWRTNESEIITDLWKIIVVDQYYEDYDNDVNMLPVVFCCRAVNCTMYINLICSTDCSSKVKRCTSFNWLNLIIHHCHRKVFKNFGFTVELRAWRDGISRIRRHDQEFSRFDSVNFLLLFLRILLRQI